MPPRARVGGGIDLAEDLEEQIHLVMRNADAGVACTAKLISHRSRVVLLGAPRAGQHPAGHLEADLALVGELDRVADEIEQHLAQPLVVADEAGGQIVVDDVDQVEVLLAGLGREQVERFLDAGAEVERKLIQREPARLDLREIENVVDDGEERFAAGAERLDVIVLRRASAPFPAAGPVMPMTPFIGVRISWLMLARNSDLVRLPASAMSLRLAQADFRARAAR